MIKPGTILMAREGLHPRLFALDEEPHSTGWRTLRNSINSHDFEQELASHGWSVFYIGSPVRTTKFGFDRTKVMDAALKRLIRDAKRKSCNSLEIDYVETRSLLGVSYVTVSGHLRQIQKGLASAGT